MKLHTGKTYKVTRPDGSRFTFDVSKVKGRWVHGRASGGYVGSILLSNIGPFFKFTEATP